MLFIIKSGTITGGTYGARIESGPLTIGDADTPLDINNPKITGDTYGVYRTGGNVNFYDGVLKGQTAAYSGMLYSIYDGTEIYKETIDGYENAYLKEAEYFLEVNGEPYNSFTSAFEAVGNSGTIKVRSTYSTNMAIPTIENNQEIVFDLNDNQNEIIIKDVVEK